MCAQMNGSCTSPGPTPAAGPHLSFAHLGSQLQWREAIVVAHGLQRPVATPQQDHVIHALNKVILRLEVFGHRHQRVQDVVSPRVLGADVSLLVLHQQLHNLRLVGACCQGQGRLTWGRAVSKLSPFLGQAVSSKPQVPRTRC